MELFNVDEILQVTRQITIHGETYNVVDQSVELMLSNIQLQKAVENKEDEEAIVNRIIKSISESIPECPVEKIKRLPFRALVAIIDFVNASDKEVVEGSKEEVTEEGKPEKK
jgi:lysyl-tRNA synthetase class I